MDSSDSGPAGRVLVVEDDPVSARFITLVLSNDGGFEVSHAGEPKAALAQLKNGNWDLVLTDVEMPGMTGLELLGELRQISPDLPVAIMTGHASLDYAVQALRSSADEFLQKPMSPQRLLEVATTLVEKGRAVRRARHRSVLAIGAHPDDVEIGAGATLLAHHTMGDMVSILTLCRGARGGSQATRADESARAAEILGATLFLDDLHDTHISEGDPTIGVISRVVEQVKPSVIYTHSLHDVHQDHRNTHRAAMVAIRGVGRVYCFQSPSATVDFRPTRFVPVDDHVEQKLAALTAFGSQVDIRSYLEPDLIQSTARYWSRFGEGRYAEAFEVIREGADAAATSLRGHTSARTTQPPPGKTGAQPPWTGTHPDPEVTSASS
jgi:two-component system response regulator HydG